jgi:site-specific recombinase XerD
LRFKVHPHMLRHACGFFLAEQGTDTRLIQDYLGHKDIKNTVICTETSQRRLSAVRVRLVIARPPVQLAVEADSP